MRLLDADPKDAAVIALVAEIDAAAEAVTPIDEEIPGVDTDAGDQQIPFITDAAGGPIAETARTEASPATSAPEEAPAAVSPPSQEAEGAAAFAEAVHTHAPEPETAPEPSVADASVSETVSASAPAPSDLGDTAPPDGLERHYPVSSDQDFEKPLGAEGLESRVESSGKIGAEDLHRVEHAAEPAGAEGLQGTEPEETVPEGTEGLEGVPAPAPLAGATGARSDEEEALDTWTPPPGATVHERKEAQKEDRMFSGPAPEPFVNETMAQLYLKQGYRQLALKVYYQLVEARPNDQGLKDRIAEIEDEDRAAHPESVVADRAPVQERREPAERPSPEPASPRSPSIESPTPGGAPGSEESPSFDRTPIDSPPSSRPSRERESIESPTRDEPRAEPEGIAARQPSIREFFATLGRRRPPRVTSAPAAPARPSVSLSPEPAVPLGGAPASASLDAVFAGATVNPADSRAASRLAGAFSGTGGATSSRTPLTPPMPTPRVNPRVPAAQESEEDVAKFRAWLDGLTGE
jgi:hypothetical protein